MSGLFLKGLAFGFLLAQAPWIGLGGTTILGFAAWQISRLLR